jgi:hypothetical protein
MGASSTKDVVESYNLHNYADSVFEWIVQIYSTGQLSVKSLVEIGVIFNFFPSSPQETSQREIDMKEILPTLRVALRNASYTDLLYVEEELERHSEANHIIHEFVLMDPSPSDDKMKCIEI